MAPRKVAKASSASPEDKAKTCGIMRAIIPRMVKERADGKILKSVPKDSSNSRTLSKSQTKKQTAEKLIGPESSIATPKKTARQTIKAKALQTAMQSITEREPVIPIFEARIAEVFSQIISNFVKALDEAELKKKRETKARKLKRKAIKRFRESSLIATAGDIKKFEPSDHNFEFHEPDDITQEHSVPNSPVGKRIKQEHFPIFCGESFTVPNSPYLAEDSPRIDYPESEIRIENVRTLQPQNYLNEGSLRAIEIELSPQHQNQSNYLDREPAVGLRDFYVVSNLTGSDADAAFPYVPDAPQNIHNPYSGENRNPFKKEHVQIANEYPYTMQYKDDYHPVSAEPQDFIPLDYPQPQPNYFAPQQIPPAVYNEHGHFNNFPSVSSQRQDEIPRQHNFKKVHQRKNKTHKTETQTPKWKTYRPKYLAYRQFKKPAYVPFNEQKKISYYNQGLRLSTFTECPSCYRKFNNITLARKHFTDCIRSQTH